MILLASQKIVWLCSAITGLVKKKNNPGLIWGIVYCWICPTFNPVEWNWDVLCGLGWAMSPKYLLHISSQWQKYLQQEAHHKVGLAVGETPRRLIRRRCRYSSLKKLESIFDTALDLMQTKPSDAAFSAAF